VEDLVKNLKELIMTKTFEQIISIKSGSKAKKMAPS
jgi:hypothetical protein